MGHFLSLKVYWALVLPAIVGAGKSSLTTNVCIAGCSSKEDWIHESMYTLRSYFPGSIFVRPLKPPRVARYWSHWSDDGLWTLTLKLWNGGFSTFLKVKKQNLLTLNLYADKQSHKWLILSAVWSALCGGSLGLYIRTRVISSSPVGFTNAWWGHLQWGDNKWPALPQTIPYHFLYLSCSVNPNSCKPI